MKFFEGKGWMGERTKTLCVALKSLFGNLLCHVCIMESEDKHLDVSYRVFFQIKLGKWGLHFIS